MTATGPPQGPGPTGSFPSGSGRTWNAISSPLRVASEDRHPSLAHGRAGTDRQRDRAPAPRSGIHLRILIAAASDLDCLSLIQELEKGGYRVEFERVASAGSLETALQTPCWDAVFARDGIPDLSVLDVVRRVQALPSDPPCIIVSDDVDEDAAVSAIKLGAADYVTEARLGRLVPAVQAGIRESERRREHRLTQEERRQAEERFRLLVAAATEGLAVHRRGRILEANQALADLFGRPVEELRTLHLAELIAPSDRTPALERVIRGDARQLEVSGVRKDGTPLRLVFHSSQVQYQGHTMHVAAMRDITEYRAMESQLRQAQKMEALGRFAGGIAHDFSNLLLAITGYSELLLMRGSLDETARDFVSEIARAGQRAASLTRQIQTFGRPQPVVPQVVDLRDVVSDMLNLLRQLIGEDIELVADNDAHPQRVRADRGHLEQVILNLAVNARDAMPHGGRLELATDTVTLREEETRTLVDIAPGSYVRLTVRDSGCGMDEETLSRVFEPFFTTKEEGKGSGLGLSITYGIVKQAGGHIIVHSRSGQGSTFRVHLPRVDDLTRMDLPHRAAVPAQGSETVLVVEDEQLVRLLVGEVLRGEGYTVLDAGDGEEALALAARHRGEIHLLVTDIVLTGMSGKSLAEHLSALRPGIRVLYISGYSPDTVGRYGDPAAFEPFIEKPFTPAALLERVSTLLGRPASS